MAYTLYDGTIVVLEGIVNTLSHILHQAEQQPGIDASTLLEARLHEDMLPLTDQVRIATQYSENVVAKLTGREPVSFGDKPTTFPDCYERIETVLKALSEADKDVVNHNGDVVTPIQMSEGQTADMSGARYAHVIAIPNIYFHITNAYGILRKEGVQLGKRDYYAGFFPHLVASK